VTAIDDLKGYMEVLAKEHEARVKAGISAAGEGPDTVLSHQPAGRQPVLRAGGSPAEAGLLHGRVEKILGRNFVRYARDVWGG